MKRTVFFVSESTGITAEAYGQSLLSQFGDARFSTRYTPFINTREKAQALANGSNVTYSVTACNDGSVEIASAEVALWYHRSSNATCGSS